MSKRTSIVKALTEKLKLINGVSPYKTNIYSQAYAKLVFWDECNNFPSIYLTPGTELREYLPSDFTWGFLNVSIKVYCKGDNSQEQLETLLDDIEYVINNNRVLEYDQTLGLETTEILITSITTDEGLLAPFAIGEINLQVRYQAV
jgi:hypothetical protein